LKKEKEDKKAEKDKYWCDFCSAFGHTTDYCYWNPDNNDQYNPVIQKGKGKQSKGKAKGGKGNGKGKGKKGKGQAKGGRGNGNFPAAYSPNTSAYYTEEQQWQNSDLNEIQEVNETPDWQDYNFLQSKKTKSTNYPIFVKKLTPFLKKSRRSKRKRMLTEKNYLLKHQTPILNLKLTKLKTDLLSFS
jgi:hypothetical protein